MKKSFTLLLLILIVHLAKSQDLPYEKLDSISSLVSDLQHTADGLSYFSGQTEYEITFPEESFNILSSNLLASTSVYKKTNGKETLAITENIDFTKAKNISIEVAGKQVLLVKVYFPTKNIESQLLENGTLINKINRDYIKFFCKYQKETKLNLYNTLLDLCTSINKESLNSKSSIANKIDREINRRNKPSDYLLQAIKEDNTKELDSLFSLGADSKWENSNGESLLHISILESAVNTFDKLIELKLGINQPDLAGNTPLITAINKKSDYFVRMLLEAGADINKTNALTPYPPFYYSIISDYASSAEILINRGIDPNVPLSIEGTNITPLSHAIILNKSVDFIQTLIDKNAKVNLKNPDGTTPLILAVTSNQTALVTLLLKNGADINLAGPSGNSALHYAVISDNPVMAIYLIERGAANKKAVNDSKLTSTELAFINGNKYMANMIKSAKPLIHPSSSFKNQEAQYAYYIEKNELEGIKNKYNKKRNKARLIGAGLLATTGGLVLIIASFPDNDAVPIIGGLTMAGTILGSAAYLTAGHRDVKEYMDAKRRLKEMKHSKPIK